MSAYLYGTKITIHSFYLSDHGIPFCKVVQDDTGWTNNVPTSCVEIR